ncbi:MAG: metallophosphoesterase [Syntrophobacteraceae bacterium]|nr:metallophosphoesterase [Desulfobacteraceae bacterium]
MSALSIVARGLVRDLDLVKPDVVVVSGDFTQRGTSLQYRQAREFLKRIHFPIIAVPGNHDVSLFNLYRRFLLPLERYKKFISEDLAPFYLDDEVVVLGINTARSLTWKNGRISREQMELIRSRFCPLPRDRFKVLVTHHPFLAPPGGYGSVVGRAEMMFERVNGCSPDLALAGHFHMSYSGETRAVYTAHEGSSLVVQAGTAISRRVRGERNAYNHLRVGGGEVVLTVRMWDGSRFAPTAPELFRREGGVWRAVRVRG